VPSVIVVVVVECEELSPAVVVEGEGRLFAKPLVYCCFVWFFFIGGDRG